MSESPTHPWQEAWFTAERQLTMEAWRGVESQHDIATLKLVDTTEEHQALEAMLEGSKPPKPEGGDGLHYLLFTPFRYTSPHSSRFRRGGDACVWYGADSVEAACAEVAYWRYRFIIESAGLAKDDTELLTTHTFFSATVEGGAIDLTAAPWDESSSVWMHPSDYTGTQELAAEARNRGIQWIHYSSVRRPGACCAAVLTVSALSDPPQNFMEWQCRATRHRVMFYSRAVGASYSWDF